MLHRPTFMFIGHKQHGKDEAAGIFCKLTGLTAIPSSSFANELFIFDALKDEYGYKTPAECFQHMRQDQALRERWYQEIKKFNKDDPIRLMRAIYEACPIYIGCRDDTELLLGQQSGLIDMTIWIDAANRQPLEPSGSMKVTRDMADLVIDNNGGLSALWSQLSMLVVHGLTPLNQAINFRSAPIRTKLAIQSWIDAGLTETANDDTGS